MTFTICDKRKSVLAAGGHCLVLGGPGSGKTTLALLKAVERIEKGLEPGQEILFLSFSRAAVSRIQSAACEHCPPDKLKALTVQTFHSFFWQVLQSHGYLIGCPRQLSIMLSHDEKALSDGVGRGDPRWDDWQKTRELIAMKQGRVCFDLFAPFTSKLLRTCRRLASLLSSTFPLIIVDEAQDTSSDQWECVEALSKRSQIICLADPNQMIYDFLPGVGPARIAQIRDALGQPHEIDLESENNRSAGTEIALFGRDILNGHVRDGPYAGVSRRQFAPKSADRDRAIRQSVGMLSKTLTKVMGKPPESIAILASFGPGVVTVSAALQSDPTINHQVIFDESFVLLSSRLAAFLLEPKDETRHLEDVASVLDLTAFALRSRGVASSLNEGIKLNGYAEKCRQGNPPSVKAVAAATALVKESRTRIFTGDPRKDWLTVKADFKNTSVAVFEKIASSLDYLVAFRRGQRICESLSAEWTKAGTYLHARQALDSALAQNQLLSGTEPSSGIHVMNMHKCKGKQFDGVILYREQYHSPFVWRGDGETYPKSRKLLQVAITRARYHVLILDEATSKCPLIDPYKL